MHLQIPFAHQFINTLSHDYNKEQPLLVNLRLFLVNTTIAHENDHPYIIIIFLKKDFFLINYVTELKFRSVLVDFNQRCLSSYKRISVNTTITYMYQP